MSYDTYTRISQPNIEHHIDNDVNITSSARDSDWSVAFLLGKFLHHSSKRTSRQSNIFDPAVVRIHYRVQAPRTIQLFGLCYKATRCLYTRLGDFVLEFRSHLCVDQERHFRLRRKRNYWFHDMRQGRRCPRVEGLCRLSVHGGWKEHQSTGKR